jgi:hypothetical protein
MNYEGGHIACCVLRVRHPSKLCDPCNHIFGLRRGEGVGMELHEGT